MNYSDRYLRQIASYSPIDVMLADVAIRIQLSPTDYQLAVDHYHAINEWLEREDSPLKGNVRDFYTQGGFAIGATVARHSSDDEFDIDVMADLAFRADVDPEAALATLHDAIQGERGSRYYLKTDRKTRCSTVIYDGMHLDVTPTVRLTGTVEKTGFIFHSKPEDPSEPKMTRTRTQTVSRDGSSARRHLIGTLEPSSSGARWTTIVNVRSCRSALTRRRYRSSVPPIRNQPPSSHCS